MEITRSALERSLKGLPPGIRDPVAGLFGPGSTFWEVQRHSVLFAGAGRAVLLQLAHPWVARAVVQHSAVARDPLGRFRRTFGWVSPMIFGDLETALWAARAVHVMHASVSGVFSGGVGPFPAGSPYRATDLSATRWVHATLWDTSVKMYEEYVGPLSLAEKRAYYVESLRFAALFGIPPRDLPADWDHFQVYVRAMCESPVLTVGDDARQLARTLFRPPRRFSSPALAIYETWTARWLPPRLRAAYDLDSRVRTASTEALDRALRSQRRWPTALRYAPAYHQARSRLSGRARPGLVPRALQYLIFGPPRTVPPGGPSMVRS